MAAILTLIAITIGFGAVVSLSIVSVIRSQWDEQDRQRDIENARRHGGGRYNV